MFRTLRTKLLVGLAPLLAIMVGLGFWAITMFYRLGGKIDVILRENYTSVLAAEGMKEALERHGLGAALRHRRRGGAGPLAVPRVSAEVRGRSSRSSGGTSRSPASRSWPTRWCRSSTDTSTLADRFLALPPSAKDERTKLYFSQLLPTFNAIKAKADDVLDLNQKNMEDESRRAREAAAVSVRLMYGRWPARRPWSRRSSR